MSEWKDYVLEEVIERFIDYRGKTPTKTASGIPLITAKIVKDGRIHEANEFISPADYLSWMTRGFPQINDVVLTTEAPLGEVALLKDDRVALAQRIITLQTKKHICNSVFLKYYIQSDVGQSVLHARATGTTVEGIKSAELKKIAVSLPSLTTQEAIAELLSSLDDKIALLHRNNKTLEQLAETLFRQWFVEEVDNSWETVLLGDFYNVSRGLSYKGSGLCENFIPGCMMMLNLNSVYEGGGYKNSGVKYYNGEFRDRHLIYPGDLIITNTEQGHEHRLIGFGAIIPKTIGDKGIFSQHIYRVTPKNNTLSVNFLYYLLKESSMREQMIGGTNGSTVNMLPIESVVSAKTVLPPKSKILRFDAIARDVQEKKENNQTQIQQLESLRVMLLPKLMSSAIKVNALKEQL